MRSVVPEEIGDLLKWRPLMLLNRTLLGPAYVESIVSYSPAVIASQGGIRLPLEIWYMIIDFSKCSPENYRYSLVRPMTSTRGDELVCKRYQRWSPFGNIKQHEEIEMYHFYLAHPEKLHHPVLDSSCPNPFYFRSPSFGSPCAFPTALLASKTKFLYVALTVPDVIKNLEDDRSKALDLEPNFGCATVVKLQALGGRFAALHEEKIGEVAVEEDWRRWRDVAHEREAGGE
ncbi:hypothetical protein FBULB1_8026 [Fusarium bulbicola]|nr:hypothetical protein FBULB1_8026 [Fusarium bulbicola]